MSDFVAVADAWVVLTNFLVAGAAVAGAAAAWSGLNTWKKQYVWRDDHDLARKLLTLFYRHRDAISTVRNPAIWTGETERAMKKADVDTPTDDEMKRFKETESVYLDRWEKVSSVRSDLYPLLLEADVAWGKEFEGIAREVFGLETELLIQIRSYLRAIHPRNSAATREAASKNMRKRRDIMYEDYSDNDPYKSELSNALENVERFLRRKMGRNLGA